MYNPASSEDNWEWVELYNAGASTVSLAGYVFDDNNGTSSGNARVFSGADGSVLYDFDGFAGDLLGLSVSGAGDVNGDGVEDMIAGGNGKARVFSGVDGSVL